MVDGGWCENVRGVWGGADCLPHCVAIIFFVVGESLKQLNVHSSV